MLYRSLPLLALFSFTLALHRSSKVCPILGPSYPKPSSLGSDSTFNEAAQRLDLLLDDAISRGTSSHGSASFNSSTLSIGVFSTQNSNLIYQRHYTDLSVKDSLVGVDKVDADTVYRIGSNGKVLSVLTFLAQVGDARLSDPITKYVPELLSNNDSADGLLTEDMPPTNWEDITIGDMASHMAGLSRDYGVNDLSSPFVRQSPGYPPLSEIQVPPCNYQDEHGLAHPCNRSALIRGILSEPAIFNVQHTPGYSNIGFELLSFALEKMTDQSMEAMFNASIVDALRLKRTFYRGPPDPSLGAIPINESASGWDADLGLLSPAGSAYSSTNDLATIGRAILSYELLPAATIRRWFKPRSFTGSASFGVGMPWEIFVWQTLNRKYEMYTKNGGYGLYSSLWVLIPDLGLGFSVLVTSGLQSPTEMETTLYLLADMIAETILPGAEEAARQQAQETFGGRYESSNTSHLNSSIGIVTDSQPGLRVSQWLSNGTDMLQELASGPFSKGQYLDFRLWPNERYSADSGKVGFTATWQVLPQQVDSRPIFDISCAVWAGVDGTTYGNIGLEQFAFGIDNGAEASWISPLALRVQLDHVVH